MYDQIQCVLYMLMTGARRAELVEYVRDRADHHHPSTGGGGGAAGASVGTSAVSARASTEPSAGGGATGTPDAALQHDVTMQVHHVSLDGPPHHGEHWGSTILPRLLEVAAAIHKIRASEHLRYRWLFAMASFEADPISCWTMMSELAPFIADVMPQVR